MTKHHPNRPNIEDVKAHTSIVGLIGRYVVLKKHAPSDGCFNT